MYNVDIFSVLLPVNLYWIVNPIQYLDAHFYIVLFRQVGHPGGVNSCPEQSLDDIDLK